MVSSVCLALYLGMPRERPSGHLKTLLERKPSRPPATGRFNLRNLGLRAQKNVDGAADLRRSSQDWLPADQTLQGLVYTNSQNMPTKTPHDIGADWTIRHTSHPRERYGTTSSQVSTIQRLGGGYCLCACLAHTSRALDYVTVPYLCFFSCHDGSEGGQRWR